MKLFGLGKLGLANGAMAEPKVTFTPGLVASLGTWDTLAGVVLNSVWVIGVATP